jgi:hypothetical protein
VKPTRIGALLLVTGCLVVSCSGDAPTPKAASHSPTTQATSTGTAESTTNTSSGWQLDVFAPVDDAMVTQPFTVCYGVTGASRSSGVVLVVSLEDPPGDGPEAQPQRFPAQVGRGSIKVPVDLTSTGRHDVRITMVVDGKPQGNVVLDNVRIAGDRTPSDQAACD